MSSTPSPTPADRHHAADVLADGVHADDVRADDVLAAFLRPLVDPSSDPGRGSRPAPGSRPVRPRRTPARHAFVAGAPHRPRVGPATPAR